MWIRWFPYVDSFQRNFRLIGAVKLPRVHIPVAGAKSYRKEAQNRLGAAEDGATRYVEKRAMVVLKELIVQYIPIHVKNNQYTVK